MSSENRPPRPKFDGYFSVESELLKIGATLPFDCFLYLERNDKIVHWIREGAIFGPIHAEKLEKFGKPRILILDEHVHAFEKYKNVQGVRRSVAPVPVPPRAGFNGGVPAPHTISIFGKALPASGSIPAASGTGTQSEVTAKLKVDVHFVNVVIKAIQAVFADVCKTQVSFKAPTKRVSSAEYPIQVNVAAFIGLNSQTIRGTVGLCFPSRSYLKFMSVATGCEFNELNADLVCGAGEFMHHIFETSRPNLAQLGYGIDPAVPFLVTGEEISIPDVLPDRGFSILFESACGPFQFEIGIKTGM